MGIYQKANDLGVRLNGKEGARARMYALATSEALEETLVELVRQSQEQTRLLQELARGASPRV